MPGSHRRSPRPDPGSGTAEGGGGGSPTGGLGQGNCLRLHGQLGLETEVWLEEAGVRRGARGWGNWAVGEARGAVFSELEVEREKRARPERGEAGVVIGGVWGAVCSLPLPLPQS